MFVHLADNPLQCVHEIVATYERYLPEHKLDPGCVFPLGAGCELPRNLRGDTRNWFFCEALTHFKRDHPANALVRARFVQTANGESDEGLLATASFVQFLKPVPLAPA